MLFIICLIVSIIGIIVCWLFTRADNEIGDEIGGLISFIITAPSIVATIIMLIIILLSFCSITKTEAKWQETYTSLNTRIDNHMYSIEDKNELIEAVQKWNENFAAQEKAHNDFWIGIFNLESLEGLDKIDLERIK